MPTPCRASPTDASMAVLRVRSGWRQWFAVTRLLATVFVGPATTAISAHAANPTHVDSASAGPAELVLQQGHEIEVLAAVYSPDGTLIASCGESEAIRLWDRASGDLVGTLPGHRERVIGLAFSPDGHWLASSSTDGTVKVWDYRRGQLAQFFRQHAGHWARRVAFSPDSRWLTAATYDGVISVWDVLHGSTVQSFPVKVRIADVLFTPDGKSVVVASREPTAPYVQFWDVATGQPGLKLAHARDVTGVAISADGHLLASADSRTVNLWELPSGRLLRGIATLEDETGSDIDLSADGQRLATTGQWINRVRSTATGEVLYELRGHEDGTSRITFSPNGDEVATASADATFRLWDAGNGALRRIFPRRAINTPVTSLAFSPDGRFEAIGSANGVVRLWDARDGRFLYDLRGHEGSVQALGFSVDGAWLFSGSADRSMRVWDTRHGTVSAVHPFFDRVDAIGTLSVGGTQGYIAVASGPFGNASLDHTIRLHQSHFDRPIRVLTGHVSQVRSLAFAPGVDRVASASADGTVKLWNSRTGDCLQSRPSESLVESIVYAPHRQWIAAGLANGAIQLLDPESLSSLRGWPAHQRPVQSLAASADGRWLGSASSDGTVAVWNVDTGAELRRFPRVTAQYLPLGFHPRQPVLAFAQRDDLVVHVNVETGETLFQRVLFSDGEWLAWNPAKISYVASPFGDTHARVRFPNQLVPVYPLELYRRELRHDSISALAGPAPILQPKNVALWWHRYSHKREWLYGGLAALLVWVAFRLRQGWVSERRRRAQEFTSRQILASQEAERKRIAAELHDGLGQNLLIIKNQLYLAQQALAARTTVPSLDEVSQTVSRTIEEVREISHNLRPYQLDRLGLTKAIHAVVRKVADSGSLPIESHVATIDGLFPPEGEIHVYRIVQEGLNNLVKHADAATARLTITRSENKIRLEIEDDGRGFEYHETMQQGAQKAGFGLTGVRERVRILGGRFVCHSTPGEGTRLHFEIPIPARHE